MIGFIEDLILCHLQSGGGDISRGQDISYCNHIAVITFIICHPISSSSSRSRVNILDNLSVF